VAALTEAEARGRAALIDVESYDVALDLTADPVRPRTEIRFGCREPGAGTFAELATAAVLGAVLNGQAVGPVRDEWLELPGLVLPGGWAGAISQAAVVRPGGLWPGGLFLEGT